MSPPIFPFVKSEDSLRSQTYFGVEVACASDSSSAPSMPGIGPLPAETRMRVIFRGAYVYTSSLLYLTGYFTIQRRGNTLVLLHNNALTDFFLGATTVYTATIPPEDIEADLVPVYCTTKAFKLEKCSMSSTIPTVIEPPVYSKLPHPLRNVPFQLRFNFASSTTARSFGFQSSLNTGLQSFTSSVVTGSALPAWVASERLFTNVDAPSMASTASASRCSSVSSNLLLGARGPLLLAPLGP